MISDIRKHFQSPIYKGIIWLCAAGLLGVFSIPALIKERSTNPWAIQVNNFAVGAKQFNWILSEKREFLSMIRSQYGPQADFLLQIYGIKNDPVSLAMEAAIKEALINDSALKLKLQVHDHTIHNLLKDPLFIKYYLGSLVPQFALTSENVINMDMLRRFLAHKGMKPAEFEVQLKEAAERKLVMDLLSVGTYSPSFDTQHAYALSTSKRDFEVVTLSLKKQHGLEKKEAISTEDIERTYALKKNDPAYIIPEKRGGIAWMFDAKHYGLMVLPAEVERYYTLNKASLYVQTPKKIEVRHILIADTTQESYLKAQAVAQELANNPAQFAVKAESISDDKESASQGGLIAPFAKGEQDAAFERAAFLLKKDGDVSSVIKTDKGFEIIQRVQVMPAEYIHLDNVRKEIETRLLQDAFSKQFATDCKNLKIKSKKDKNEIEEFIHAKNGSQRLLAVEPIDESLVSKTLFSIKTVGMFDICVDKDWAYIVQLTDQSKATVAPLAEVKDRIADYLYQERALKAVKQNADEVLNQSKGAQTSLAALSKQYKGKMRTFTHLTYDDIEKNSVFKKLGLQATVFDTLEHSGLTRLIINQKGAHIIKVTKVIKGDQKEDKKEKMDALKGQKNRLMSDSFVASLYRNATIKTNESMTNLQKNYSL